MKRLLASLGLLILWSGSAYAVCTKPTGNYVGSAAGEIYNTQTRVTVKFTLNQTISINANGGGTFTQFGEATNGPILANLTFGSAQNIFVTTSCKGTLTVNGRTYQYTSSNSGNVMTVIDITPFPDTNVSIYVIRLEKV